MSRMSIEITFSVDDDQQAADLQGLLAHIAPFVVDNVEVHDAVELVADSDLSIAELLAQENDEM